MKNLRIRYFSIVLGVLLCITGASPVFSLTHSVEADGAELEIELIVPAGGRAVKPAVIFAGGSSPVDFRDYEKDFRETLIEEVFLPRDIAVVYVNKRGLGGSTGN